MSGNTGLVWLCLAGGIVLQLIYMVQPAALKDWGGFLLGAATVLLLAGWSYLKGEHLDGLILCGIFTLCVTVAAQDRLLPRLGEGAILTWTTVFLSVLAGFAPWHSLWPWLALWVGLCVVTLLVLAPTLPYALKVIVYGWFLLTVVGIGVLQFRGADFGLIMDGRVGELNHLAAFIDGMAGAYIGVHAEFLFELLPIPSKSESWSAFRKRWGGYLDAVVAHFDEQRLSTPVALVLVAGIAALTGANHVLHLVPEQLLANILLLAIPAGWRYLGMRGQGAATRASATNAAEPPAT